MEDVGRDVAKGRECEGAEGEKSGERTVVGRYEGRRTVTGGRESAADPVEN